MKYFTYIKLAAGYMEKITSTHDNIPAEVLRIAWLTYGNYRVEEISERSYLSRVRYVGDSLVYDSSQIRRDVDVSVICPKMGVRFHTMP